MMTHEEQRKVLDALRDASATKMEMAHDLMFRAEHLKAAHRLLDRLWKDASVHSSMEAQVQIIMNELRSDIAKAAKAMLRNLKLEEY